MLQILNELNNFVIEATDGKIGRVNDFYFDDRRWVIRYIVVEIGDAPNSHKVLLTPAIIKHLNQEDKIIVVDMSSSEVSNSPRIDIARSVSPLSEIDYLSYYGYAFYWDSNLQRSVSDKTTEDSGDDMLEESSKNFEDVFIAVDSVRRMYGDRHLRSCCEIVRYHIQAIDGEIGYLQSMLIDDDTWAIQYCITATSSWWPGHQVLITPQSIKDISWGNAKIYVDMTQQQIKEAPLFDISSAQNSRYELGVYLHRERNSYARTETGSQSIN